MKRRPAIYYVLSSEQFAVPDLLDYGQASERAGFDGLWISDHFQPWQPNEGHSGSAWVALGALSQRTSGIEIGTGVTCPTFRYRPAVVAQTWASLSLLAPGRVFLGVGTGENLNEGAAGGGWASYEERGSRLLEAVKIIRALWTGEHTRIKGRFWDVDARLYDAPASPIPLYIAAGGPRSARLSGLLGDGLITGAETLRKDHRVKAAWEQGSSEAGKEPGALIVEHWAVVGGQKEARAAAGKWRFMTKAWEHGFFDNVDPADIQARAEKEVSLESVLEGWTVSEDPRVHVEAIEGLAQLGATHVAVHVGTPDQEEVIEFFGKKVLPSLRAA
jgi:TAT-translocated FGD2 family F420-dependent dehydrogenase